MKQKSIIGSADQILNKNGETLAKFFERTNDKASSSDCVLILFDFEHPIMTVGESPLDLLSSVFDSDFTTQFVYTDMSNLWNLGLCDIVYPIDSKTGITNYKSIYNYRQYRLDKSIISDDGSTVHFDLIAFVNEPKELCYAYFSVDDVSVDLNKKTVTYTEYDSENQITVSATFSFLIPDGKGGLEPPKVIELNPDGTVLKLYTSTPDDVEYYLVSIANNAA